MWWPLGGFTLVEKVVGGEFVEAYRVASLRRRRRLMQLHGELMGTLHQMGVQSKVHPGDLICIPENYEMFRTCLVIFDRERGCTHPINLSLKKNEERR